MENQDNKFNKSIDQNSNNRVVSSDEKTNKVEKISLDEIKKAKEELKGEDSSKNQTQQKNDSNKFDSFKEQLEKLRGESTNEKKEEPEKSEKKTKFDWDSISFDEKPKPSTQKTEEPKETFKFDWNSISLDEEKSKPSETQKTNNSEETFKFDWSSVPLDDLNDTEKSQEVQQEVTESEQTTNESDTQIFATVAGDHDFDKLHIKLQIDPDTNIGTILTDPEAIEKLEEKKQEKETKQEESSKEVESETISKESEDVKIQIEKQEKTPEIQEKSELIEKTTPVEQKEEKTEVKSQKVQEKEEKPLKEETSQTQTLSLEEIERIRNELLNKKPNQEVVESKENPIVEEKTIAEAKPVVEEKTIEEEKPQKQEEVQQTTSEEHVQKMSFEEIEKLRNELHGNNNSKSTETTNQVVEKEEEVQQQEKNENLFANSEQKTEPQNQTKEQENAEKTQDVQVSKTDKQTVKKNEHDVSSILDESLFNNADFEGMTDEEIVQEIERRKRLADLKQKYSEDNNKDPNDIGEYKKSLDFASNATIKHFKMRPPKRVVASIIISIFLAIAVAITTTLLVLKKPPEPATLVSSRISQTKISHYVGDTIDLRGIYIEELYSDGSKQTVQVSSSIISEKSSNINNDLVVVEFSENAFIRFTLNGKTQSLFVELDEMKIKEISVFEIYPTNYVAESKIRFDTILIMAEITNKNNVVIGEQRIDPRKATFRIEGQEGNLETDNEGVLLYKTDGSNKILLEEGNYTLVVTITENGVDFEKTIQISVS